MLNSEGGAERPFAAMANAGGTVIRPTLKHTSEMEIVWSMAPSGSSIEMRLAAAAFSAVDVSWVVVLPPIPLGVGGEGVTMADAAASAGCRRDAWRMFSTAWSGVLFCL